MRQARAVFTSLLLAGFLLGIFATSIPQIHEAQAPESSGNVDFVPNIIPWSTVYLKVNKTSNIEGSGDRFRITWENPQRKPWQRQLWSVDFRLQINATKYRRAGGVWFNDTRMWTVAGFQSMFNATVDYAKNMNTTLVQWGVVIDNPDITNEWVHHVWIKMVDTNFPVDLIQLETIEPNPPAQNFTIKRFHLPENLDLSFEDLFYKGYMVDALNLTDVVAYGFYGKTHLNLDPIAFSANTITVTGYTSGTPCTFNDLWLADKAGTATIKTEETYTTTKYDNIETQIRPTDEKVLSLTVHVVDQLGAGTPIVTVYGYDAGGYSLTGQAVIDAGVGDYPVLWLSDPTFYAYFSTVALSGGIYVYVPSGVQFTFSIYQSQWGVVWKQSTIQYVFDAKIVIGDGSTTTWFIDTSKQVTFNSGCITANAQILMATQNKATLRFGTVINTTDKSSKDGCQIVTLTTSYWYYVTAQWTGAAIELYSSSFVAAGTDRAITKASICWNCLFTGLGSSELQVFGTADVQNLLSTGANYAVRLGTGTFNKIFSMGTKYPLRIYGNTATTVSDVFARDSTTLVYCQQVTVATNFYIINVDSDVWTITWSTATGATIFRQYSFDLVTTANATTTLYDKNDNVVFTVTDADGTLTQQTISRGFYNQTGGNTLYDYSPHRLVIEKEGYQTYNQTFTLDEKIDWRIMLEPETSSIASMVPFFLLGCIIILPIGILIAKKH